MQCPKCDFNGNPNLEETGPHTKAMCPECGSYIKMVGSDELDAIIEASIDKHDDDDEKGWIAMATLVIETDAPRKHMLAVLTQVGISLAKGYICGMGNATWKPANIVYHYEFYYK